MRGSNYYIFTLVMLFTFHSSTLDANEFGLTDVKYNEIESRVKSMGYRQLVETQSNLLEEKIQLEDNQESTQNPTANKSIGDRLKEINAELSQVQRAIAALVGVAALSALTDDGYSDNVPPVITVTGSNPASVELGATYSDQGATAFDINHGNTAVTTSGSVDTSSVGSYTLTYTATDLDGNTATASRVVNVVDTTAPVVTVTGSNPTTVELGAAYTDAGATATDLSGTVTVVTSGEVDSDTLGTYTITYTSTDASSNVGTAIRTVNVTDTVIPVFTSSSTFEVDEGAIAVVLFLLPTCKL